MPAQAIELVYDSANRLVRTETEDFTVVYRYDGLGNLVRTCTIPTFGETVCSDLIVDMTVEHPVVLGEVRNGTEHVLYAWGPTGLAAVQQGGQQLLPVKDPMTSVRGLVDSTGTVVGRVAYDPYGRVRTRVGQQTRIGYTGEWTGDDELVYLRARHYAPEIGRFVQRDGFEGALDQPESLNRYAYAHNNPFVNVDPSGRVVVAILPALAFLLSVGLTWAALEEPAQTPTHAGDIHEGTPLAVSLAVVVASELTGTALIRYVAAPVLKSVAGGVARQVSRLPAAARSVLQTAQRHVASWGPKPSVRGPTTTHVPTGAAAPVARATVRSGYHTAQNFSGGISDSLLDDLAARAKSTGTGSPRHVDILLDNFRAAAPEDRFIFFDYSRGQLNAVGYVSHHGVGTPGAVSVDVVSATRIAPIRSMLKELSRRGQPVDILPATDELADAYRRILTRGKHQFREFTVLTDGVDDLGRDSFVRRSAFGVTFD